MLRLVSSGRIVAVVNNNKRNLTEAELTAILQKQYRRFISGVRFRQFADGRPFIEVEFAVDNGDSNNVDKLVLPRAQSLYRDV